MDRYYPARTFAAHFYLNGGMSWEDTSHMGPLPDSRFPCLQIYLNWYTGRAAIRTDVFRQVAAALIEGNNDWFSLRANKWVVDPTKLRSAFELSEFDWLSGPPLVVEPDFTPANPDDSKPALVTLTLEPGLFQNTIVSSEHPTQGRPKQQKFGILDAPNLLPMDLAGAPGLLGRALVYFDIDNFKAVNTRYTERVVDRDLFPAIQKLVAKAASGLGYAYAEGGDEMIVLLPNANLTLGVAFADALRRLLADSVFAVNDETVRLTASFGVAAAHEVEASDPHALGDAANHAKNHAKQKWEELRCSIQERCDYDMERSCCRGLN